MIAAVIGSTGNNSASWTQALLRADIEVVQLVRHPQSQKPGHHLQQRRFDLDDADSYAAALAGIDVLGLITPSVPGQDDRELALIDTAARLGMQRIVKLSVIGADLATPISQFARWHARVEARLRESAIASVVLRPNFFMQNLLRQRAGIEAGSYSHYAGHQRAAYIDAADIAAVAAVVAAGGFDGKALELTGPAALGAEDIARALAEVTGRPITVTSPTPAEMKRALLAQGAPPWLADAQVEMLQAVHDERATHVAALTPTVEATTGRAPRSLQEFLADSVRPWPVAAAQQGPKPPEG
jgi:uncharacterized protein YbjT (DUF2867 family)